MQVSRLSIPIFALRVNSRQEKYYSSCSCYEIWLNTWLMFIPSFAIRDGCVALFRHPITPTTHYSDSPLLRRPIFPTMQNRTQSTNPWSNQVYPTGCSVGQANLDGPQPRQNVLERKRSFYPRLYIPLQGNYDRPTWYGES